MTYKIYSISITDKNLQKKLDVIAKDPTRNLSASVQRVLQRHVTEI